MAGELALSVSAAEATAKKDQPDNNGEATGTAIVARIFSEALGIDPCGITDDLSPETVEHWDSLKSVMIIALLQEAFSIEFTDNEVMAMRTVGLVKKILRRKGVF